MGYGGNHVLVVFEMILSGYTFSCFYSDSYITCFNVFETSASETVMWDKSLGHPIKMQSLIWSVWDESRILLVLLIHRPYFG